MRYSLAKAATVALLVLGSTFLGINAFPAGAIEVPDVEPPVLTLYACRCSGRMPSDLAILNYEIFTEDTTKPIILVAYTKLKKTNQDAITVTATSTGIEEVWDTLPKTNFGGKIAERLRADFGTPLPIEIVLSGGGAQGNMAVYLK
ncbi:hypothetical protein BGZ60DRAFT_437685 [Tricladium varicosporioides]|nr:hypothetical protein BGZ60DRAFT_437685 [Hymenoscyphus varicosporioides]